MLWICWLTGTPASWPVLMTCSFNNLAFSSSFFLHSTTWAGFSAQPPLNDLWLWPNVLHALQYGIAALFTWTAASAGNSGTVHAIGTSVDQWTHSAGLVRGDRAIDVMSLDLAILLAIDHDFIILGVACIRFSHKPSTHWILVLGCGEDIGKVTRVKKQPHY